MTHRNYCSLWDRRYCAKGLALYESLAKHSSDDFTLHILAMCDETERIIDELNFPCVRLLNLGMFERTAKLKSIRESRSWAEYCWTCGSNLMSYLMPSMDFEGITYLDSDLFFYSDPRVIFEEIGNYSLGIVPHRFPEDQRQMEVNGIFNVGWVGARNTTVARVCIERWAAQCRKRCSADVGCGDQVYLDSWPMDYPGEVAVIENIGVGLAPWNIAQYVLSDAQGAPTVNGVPLVFYHMHEFVDESYVTGYPMRAEDLKIVYSPYVTAWRQAKKLIEAHEAVRL